MISVVILAAGLSSRFGSPKALASIQGIPVIEHLQRQLLPVPSVREILVVLGDSAEKIHPFLLKHTKVTSVYNKDYILGQTSSFQAGLKAASTDAKGIMLLPVDYPLIRPKTFHDLAQIFVEKQPAALVPVYDRRRGHPSIFHRKLVDELLALDSAIGINTVLHRHADQILSAPVDDAGVIQSFNTPEEWEKIRGLRLSISPSPVPPRENF